MTTDTTTPGRLETPTGRLVVSSHAPREEWLTARRTGIAATDLVAIMGLSNYRTAFDVWTDKVMEPDFDGELSEAGLWGQRLEDPVAQEWAERHGVKVRRVGLIHNDQHAWALASLDRIVTGCPDGRCALEVKTRNLFVQAEWERDLPADVLTQTRWQLLVSGLDHIHVAALIGGQRLVEHRVERDADHEAKLLNAARLVWEAVQSNTTPDLPAELWTSEFLDQRHPDRSGEVEVDPTATELVHDYNRISGDIKYLEGEKEKLRTRLVGLLGDGDTATVDGEVLYTFKGSSVRRLNSKALLAKYSDLEKDPEVWNTSTTRSLRITTKKGTNS